MEFIPDRHTLFTVAAGTFIGTPAPTAAIRAGFWPAPAVTTCPISTWPMAAGSTPERSMAALIAIAPSSVAVSPDSEPRNRPVGVRAPATMTDAEPAVLDGAPVMSLPHRASGSATWHLRPGPVVPDATALSSPPRPA